MSKLAIGSFIGTQQEESEKRYKRFNTPPAVGEKRENKHTKRLQHKFEPDDAFDGIPDRFRVSLKRKF